MSDHLHAIPSTAKEKPLFYALILTSIFLIAEVIGGFVTGSLALISDAAHMLTDVMALTIALAAIRISRKPADILRTFGYYRFEILAAVFNTILLFFVAGYIIFEAYQRFFIKVEIQSLGMLLIAAVGLIVNIISMRLLSSGKDKSLNIKGAYLEVWSDMLGSVGVIIAALIIRYTGWDWVDSIIAIAIGLWVLPRTWVLLKDSINILLEGVPEGIDLVTLKKTIESVKGVVNIHELHVWAISSGKISLTAHVVIDDHQNCDNILNNIRKILADQFNITHTTLQHEIVNCNISENTCNITST